MAEIQLLTPEELAERAKPKGKGGRGGRQRSPERQRTIETYKATMQDAEPGFAADVVLAPEEDKRKVRLDLKAAADELGKVLDFRPIRDPNRIYFRFITPEEKAAKPKPPGRPRKRATDGQAQEESEQEEAQPAVQEQPAETPKKRGRQPTTAAA